HPKAGSKVKKNRSIYLTILSDQAPLALLPELRGRYDYEQYTRQLKRFNISHYVAEQVYDPKQEENTILHLFLDDRKITEEDLIKGVKVPHGSRLGFVVTVRKTGEVAVPNIVCQTYGTAEFVIGGTNLKIGRVIADGISNRSEAYVVRTEPTAGKMVQEGQSLTIYLSATRPASCD
ncbi:MAG: PASTA domain-containing protein, partial [Bacteroidota bacterium]